MASNFIRVMDFMNNFKQEVKYNPEFPDEVQSKLSGIISNNSLYFSSDTVSYGA